MKPTKTGSDTWSLHLTNSEVAIIRNCFLEAENGLLLERFGPVHEEVKTIREKLDGRTSNDLEFNREHLLTAKNVLYEAYVELGEWTFLKRIGSPPEDALALLKQFNGILKRSL